MERLNDIKKYVYEYLANFNIETRGVNGGKSLDITTDHSLQ